MIERFDHRVPQPSGGHARGSSAPTSRCSRRTDARRCRRDTPLGAGHERRLAANRPKRPRGAADPAWDHLAARTNASWLRERSNSGFDVAGVFGSIFRPCSQFGRDRHAAGISIDHRRLYPSINGREGRKRMQGIATTPPNFDGLSFQRARGSKGGSTIDASIAPHSPHASIDQHAGILGNLSCLAFARPGPHRVRPTASGSLIRTFGRDGPPAIDPLGWHPYPSPRTSTHPRRSCPQPPGFGPSW